MGSTTAPTWLVLLAPVAAILAATLAAWTARHGWHIEQQREHQRWIREQRMNAYLHFLDTSNDMLWAARAKRVEDPSWIPSVEWLESLDRALLRVQLFGSSAAAKQAQFAIKAFAEGAAVTTDARDHAMATKLDVLKELVDLVRRDLVELPQLRQRTFSDSGRPRLSERVTAKKKPV